MVYILLLWATYFNTKRKTPYFYIGCCVVYSPMSANKSELTEEPALENIVKYEFFTDWLRVFLPFSVKTLVTTEE